MTRKKFKVSVSEEEKIIEKLSLDPADYQLLQGMRKYMKELSNEMDKIDELKQNDSQKDEQKSVD